MHRIVVKLYNAKQWYEVIREANTLYGRNNWKGQGHTKRKLDRRAPTDPPVSVWFEVPDHKFAMWVAIKYAKEVTQDPVK
jgi:hypothetical protein